MGSSEIQLGLESRPGLPVNILPQSCLQSLSISTEQIFLGFCKTFDT